ncbi:MAG: hypothetical protein Q8M01_11160 [Rubrivivax sp.]|nr:hypothetical protein [Rubrivivax sp.]
MAADVIIPDRGEFVDALRQLRRGRVLVRAADTDDRCLLDGSFVYSAYRPLARYGLIDEFPNPDGCPNVHYYRLNPRGREFADRAFATWRRQPLLRRLAVRLTG